MAEIRFTSEITIEPIQQVGSDAMIVAAARVSTRGALAATDEGDCYGLLNYLMRSRHGSPFEHGLLTMRVHAPLFVWREWHRHRIGVSYSEESARYKELEPVFYVPPRDRPMIKVDGWKPGRPKFDRLGPPTTPAGTGPSYDQARYECLLERLKESYRVGYANYEKNLEAGFDPGLARDCLPVGIYSSCWVTANPRSLMAFLSLRTHEPEAKFVSYPLFEIESAARKLEAIAETYWPLTMKAFRENGRVAP